MEPVSSIFRESTYTPLFHLSYINQSNLTGDFQAGATN